MDKQAVVDNDALAKPNAEGEDAQDLDALLSEYEAAQTNEPKVEADDDVKSVVSYVKQVQEREVRQQTEADIASAVKTIKDGFEQQLPDRVIRGVLLDMADQNPKFLQAWNDRHKNPAGFNKVLKAVQTELKAEFGSLPDKDLTDDRAALASAVRGATKSTTADEAQELQDLDKQSDADFQKTWRDLGL